MYQYCMCAPLLPVVGAKKDALLCMCIREMAVSQPFLIRFTRFKACWIPFFTSFTSMCVTAGSKLCGRSYGDQKDFNLVSVGASPKWPAQVCVLPLSCSNQAWFDWIPLLWLNTRFALGSILAHSYVPVLYVCTTSASGGCEKRRAFGCVHQGNGCISTNFDPFHMVQSLLDPIFH